MTTPKAADRMFSRAPAVTAAITDPPSARTVAEANWALPPKTNAENPTASINRKSASAQIIPNAAANGETANEMDPACRRIWLRIADSDTH